MKHGMLNIMPWPQRCTSVVRDLIIRSWYHHLFCSRPFEGGMCVRYKEVSLLSCLGSYLDCVLFSYIDTHGLQNMFLFCPVRENVSNHNFSFPPHVDMFAPFCFCEELLAMNVLFPRLSTCFNIYIYLQALFWVQCLFSWIRYPISFWYCFVDVLLLTLLNNLDLYFCCCNFTKCKITTYLGPRFCLAVLSVIQKVIYRDVVEFCLSNRGVSGSIPVSGVLTFLEPLLYSATRQLCGTSVCWGKETGTRSVLGRPISQCLGEPDLELCVCKWYSWFYRHYTETRHLPVASLSESKKAFIYL